MSTIPASSIVSVIPSVLSAGGVGLTGTGLILTHNIRLPIGTVQAFSGPSAVSSYFGASDHLVGEANIYFAGFEGSSIQPSTLLMAQYNQAAVAAYLRGGNISSLTIAQLQALSGSLTVVMDGYAHVISSISLATYSTQSAMAAAIQAAFSDPSEASFTASIGATFTASGSGTNLTVSAIAYGYISPGDTISGTGVPSGTTIKSQTSGTPGGDGVYVTSVATTASSASLTAASTVLNVTGSVTGTITDGLLVAGSGVTGSPNILSQISGTAGGVGLYQLSGAQQTVVPPEAMTTTASIPTVTYDSVSGAFIVMSGITGPGSTAAFATGTLAAPLLLTSATGAVLSQGAAAQTPSAFMSALVTSNNSWVNFMTHFDPDGGSGNTVKQQFAAWKNGQNSRYGYFCWDPDASPAASVPASSSLGQILKANGDSGTLLIWEGGATVDSGLCAFALGLAASINYQQTNGRTDFAFRQGIGELANVTDSTTAGNLLANGYCFYGAYGAANAPYIWFQNGQITGPFEWADSYETQIWLNNLFQTALLTLFQNSLSVPFTVSGIALIEETLGSVIQQGLAFGAFAPNTLNSAQIAEVNASAGANIAGALQSQGYYIQVLLPNQTVQAARGPWPITVYYIDRNSVQSISLSSVLVQ
jgi:Protein of unknown function (DUF3383)